MRKSPWEEDTFTEQLGEDTLQQHTCPIRLDYLRDSDIYSVSHRSQTQRRLCGSIRGLSSSPRTDCGVELGLKSCSLTHRSLGRLPGHRPSAWPRGAVDTRTERSR